MLIHLQFPFTDLRSFAPPPLSRVGAPSWPAPIAPEEFVHSFGAVRQRPKGGFVGWIAESSFCDSRRALRFREGALEPRKKRNAIIEQIGFRVAFRRLYFDGYAVGKIDVGLAPLALPRKPISLYDFVTSSLTTPVTIPSGGTRAESYALHMAGKPLLRLYSRATSLVAKAHPQNEVLHYLTSESPIVFLELTATAAAQFVLPDFARRINLNPSCQFDLLFWRTPILQHTISVWCTVQNKGMADNQIRHLRIYLLRLNAEHQALKRVLKAIAIGQIAPKARNHKAELLQAYLNEATRRIRKCESQAQDRSNEIDELAFSAFELAEPGELDALMARFKLIDVRGNIARKVREYSARNTFNLQIYGPVDMSKKVIKVTADKSVVNIDSTLANVSQTIDAIPVGSEADKHNLQQLMKQLADLLNTVPNDKAEAAETVATKATELVKAAAKEKPNESLLKETASGLKQTAEFIKDVVSPIAKIAGQIISLISKVHGIPL